MKAIFWITCISTAAALQGAPTVSVSCNAPLITSVTSSSSDGITNCTSFTNGNSMTGGGASATALVNLQLAANPANFSLLSTLQSAFAEQAPRQSETTLFGPAAGSSIQIAFTDTLITAGTSRSGYLQIQGYGNGATFYDGGATMTSGLVLNGGPTTEITCFSNSGCTPGTGYYNYYSLIPVTLGTALTIEANGQTTTSASYFDGVSGGSLATTYNFRFLEADGLTPVAVSEAPEPATFGLISISLGAAGFFRRKRRLNAAYKKIAAQS